MKSSGLKNSCRNWPLPTSSAPYASVTAALLQGRNLRRVEVEPLLRQAADRPVRLQRVDRLADVRDERADLREHRAVALLRGDLTDDAAVGARHLLVLRLDDRQVEDQ